jgi:hypothetical protein
MQYDAILSAGTDTLARRQVLLFYDMSSYNSTYLSKTDATSDTLQGTS